MCGIAGFVRRNSSFDSKRVLHAMGQSLVHRGPDDSGKFWDSETGVGFVHRRLSIIDLSPAGHQPMHSDDGRFVLCYNGEIYNFPQLKKELSFSSKFRGGSDTEVLLAACRTWGVEKTLDRLDGMFAFALLDLHKKTLLLARDPFGEKPLYWGMIGKDFVFASELKAFKAFPGFEASIRGDAVRDLLALNYIPSPKSIFQDIHKLQAGSTLQLDLSKGFLSNPIEHQYFRPVERFREISPTNISEKEAIDHLEEILSASCSRRMISDVPLGAFLSGGIDSSLICALAQKSLNRPLRTFTIGFDDPKLNEADHARAVSEYLGTEHTEIIVQEKDLWSSIPELPSVWCEPFADASQIPTFLVSKMAREHVTVTLSGDGGDELFGGYNRYMKAIRLWNTIGRLPSSLRHLSAGILRFTGPALLPLLLKPISTRLRLGDSLSLSRKLPPMLATNSFEEFYSQLLLHHNSLAFASKELMKVRGGLEPRRKGPGGSDWMRQMTSLDMHGYLSEDILVKVDRAAMAVSLESRIPLLNREIYDFTATLPTSMKWRNGQGKWILRELLYRHVPRELIDRPKQGFTPPVHEWLRGPVRDWAEELLAPQFLEESGFFDVPSVQKAWQIHLSRKADLSFDLWPILMFQAWKKDWFS